MAKRSPPAPSLPLRPALLCALGIPRQLSDQSPLPHVHKCMCKHACAPMGVHTHACSEARRCAGTPKSPPCTRVHMRSPPAPGLGGSFLRPCSTPAIKIPPEVSNCGASGRAARLWHHLLPGCAQTFRAAGARLGSAVPRGPGVCGPRSRPHPHAQGTDVLILLSTLSTAAGFCLPLAGHRMASALPLLLLCAFAPAAVPEVLGPGDGTGNGVTAPCACPCPTAGLQGGLHVPAPLTSPLLSPPR